ncbi:MAG: LCP family protein [Chloroflexota bacterium]|nr:LCP family protein [Chloroflexota bacterium]
MFFKRNWKWLVGGVALIAVVIIGFLILKVSNFVGDSTGAVRTNMFETPAVNAVATSTALAIEAELFGRPKSSPVAPTPQLPISNKVVDRIKNGERITVLMLGYGGTGHEGAFLTDTLLLSSYDPQTKTVTQFNIPRDLYVFAAYGPKGVGYWTKINAIFAYLMEGASLNQEKLDPRYQWKDDKGKQDAAANLVADTVQKFMGVRVDYWVAMNFDGFRKLVDSMGGIDINVERAFVDNEYPRNDNDQIDAGIMTVKFEAGLQHMDGERAIQFARSRKSKGLEEGDPARSRRQMKVIAAIKEKALKQNLAFDLLKYLDALQGNIRTTLSFDELRGLASYVTTTEGKGLADSSKFDSEIMTGNNVLQAIEQPEYRIIPQEGQGKYTELQQWVQTAFTYAELRREQVFIQVVNVSEVTGIAAKWSDYLLTHGFRVIEAGNDTTEDKSVLRDYTNNTAIGNIKQIQKYFPGIKVVSQTADKKPYEGAPDLMLYLGKDYKAISTSQSVGG